MVAWLDVLPETQFVGTRLRMGTTRVLSVGGTLPPWGATPSSLPVMPFATRSQHVVFAYDQVVRPHRSYRPSGGLVRGKPRTRHMWICLQLSGARGMDNGGVRALYSHIYSLCSHIVYVVIHTTHPCLLTAFMVVVSTPSRA